MASTDPTQSRPRARFVTDEEVWAAAEGLVAEGKRPTDREVLATIGRGSMATISKYMQIWRREQQAASPQAAALPEDIANLIGEAIGKQVAASRAELETALADAEQTQDALVAENERLSEDVDQLTTCVSELERELSACEARTAEAVAAQESAAAEIERERDSAEKARIAAAQAQLKAETLEQSVQAGQTERERLTAKLDKAESSIAEAERQAAVAGERAQGLETARDRLEQAHAALAKDLEAARTQANSYLEDRSTQMAEASALKAEVKGLEARLQAAFDARTAAETDADRERQRASKFYEDLKAVQKLEEPTS